MALERDTVLTNLKELGPVLFEAMGVAYAQARKNDLKAAAGTKEEVPTMGGFAVRGITQIRGKYHPLLLTEHYARKEQNPDQPDEENAELVDAYVLQVYGDSYQTRYGAWSAMEDTYRRTDPKGQAELRASYIRLQREDELRQKRVAGQREKRLAELKESGLSDSAAWRTYVQEQRAALAHGKKNAADKLKVLAESQPLEAVQEEAKDLGVLGNITLSDNGRDVVIWVTEAAAIEHNIQGGKTVESQGRKVRLFAFGDKMGIKAKISEIDLNLLKLVGGDWLDFMPKKDQSVVT